MDTSIFDGSSKDDQGFRGKSATIKMNQQSGHVLFDVLPHLHGISQSKVEIRASNLK